MLKTAGENSAILGRVAKSQITTTDREACQNLNLATLSLVPAYRARTYTVTAYVAMNRSLPAEPEVIKTLDNLQGKSCGEAPMRSVIIKSLVFDMVKPTIMTSEDATILPRINLTVTGIVFSEMMATNSRMLTVNIGSR